jgi:glycyl-tRNA synthetase (class II)
MSSKIAGMGLAGGVVGAVGGVAYATGKLAESYKEAARGAYDLDTHAKNTAMSVQDFSRLSGALQLVGADSESAASSIEGIFKSLNEANSAGNAVVMSAMAQIGAQIEKNKDGSVNTLKTLESIARIFPKFVLTSRSRSLMPWG